jgi:nitroimidazol reductase NimA-like FMN-containing flavoprotein (pyridoxamine 5'-phosphate oxidase superfamily)
MDGLVLARTAAHHSMNFRSAVIYGQFEEVQDTQLKAAVLESFIELVSPGRAALVRSPSPAELGGVRVLRIALREAAVKIRTGGPVDTDDDLLIPVWAGVIPLRVQAGQPEPDTGCAQMDLPGIPTFIAG